MSKKIIYRSIDDGDEENRRNDLLVAVLDVLHYPGMNTVVNWATYYEDGVEEIVAICTVDLDYDKLAHLPGIFEDALDDISNISGEVIRVRFNGVLELVLGG